MKTNFTAEQLKDPELAEANEILKTCVHYGFCTNTCPTYVVTRDENESPRGRIDLIREMLENGGAPKPSTVQHIDSCLSCLSCMTTCAADVDYVHLIDKARVHVEEHYDRPIIDRLLRSALAATIPYPKRFSAALKLGRIGRRFGKLAPKQLRPLLDLVPDAAAEDILAPQLFKAEGERRYRVAILAGCAQQVLNGNINAATIRILQRHGCDVVVAEGSGCCGSLALHMGRDEQAKASATRNVTAWQQELAVGGLDAIIVNSSGCGTTIKDYGHLFQRDSNAAEAKEVAAKTCDITEFLCKIGLNVPESPLPYVVAYHDPCSMQHGQKVKSQPRQMLRKAGFTVQDVPEGHFCCGSAGTYNMLQPEMAAKLGQRKADHIASTTHHLVATGNIGCMTQIQKYLGKPVVHSVELLDWATGGPMPPAVVGVDLPDPASLVEIPKDVPQQAATPAPISDGFW
ncbi:glycolate oxidase subunit GlcF [Rhizobium laguerreae]|uniref:glycolate oxidase subunit GlcF n=1 Tax=Rhizobium laguerreae TaxID=1076926 RepID=UPI001C90F823|nr:glycolate oxidase subunit GlcF [Rhizobium laguerreae]MBY3300351.1 glycolate oxidase subunit GlcF [Rhizobium laguerreae]